MDEEKRTYQSDIELIPELRPLLDEVKEQEPGEQSDVNRPGARRFLSEELIVGLIKKIEAL